MALNLINYKLRILDTMNSDKYIFELESNTFCLLRQIHVAIRDGYVLHFKNNTFWRLRLMHGKERQLVLSFSTGSRIQQYSIEGAAVSRVQSNCKDKTR